MSMIKSEEQAILCESERHFVVPFDKNIQANETKSFVIHSSGIIIRRIVTQESSCKDKFCDRQNNSSKEEGRKPCGCCSTSGNYSCIIASVAFVHSNPSIPGEKMRMVNFTSLQFQFFY